MRPMPSSTPIRSRASRRRSPAATSIISDFGIDLERQVRGALGADPRLRAARLDLERLPRAVAPPAILHHHLDQLHRRRAGRHRDASRSTARSRGRSARKPLKPEKSVNFSLGATANPFRGLTFTADYYQIKIKDRIVLTENLGAAGSGTAAQNAAVKAILDANGFQSVGAARFFINGLDTTTQGVDVVAAYRLGARRSRQLDADRGLQLQQDRRSTSGSTRSARSRTIPGLVLFGRDRGHPLHRRPAARQDRAQRRRRHRRVRRDRAHHPLRQGRLAGRGRADRRPDQPDRARPGRHLPRRQVDHRPRAALQGRATGSSSRSAPNNLFDVYPDRSPFGAAPGVDRRRLSGEPGYISLTRSSRRSASTAASSTAACRSTSRRRGEREGSRPSPSI